MTLTPVSNLVASAPRERIIAKSVRSNAAEQRVAMSAKGRLACLAIAERPRRDYKGGKQCISWNIKTSSPIPS